MSEDLMWLSVTALATALFWVPYILNRIAVRGLTAALGYTDETPHSAWAERSIKAHRNAVENLVVFAPLILVANLAGASDAWTALLAAIYFFARIVHFLVYTFGIPVVRTLSFAVGWACTVLVALHVLGWA